MSESFDGSSTLLKTQRTTEDNLIRAKAIFNTFPDWMKNFKLTKYSRRDTNKRKINE